MNFFESKSYKYLLLLRKWQYWKGNHKIPPFYETKVILQYMTDFYIKQQIYIFHLMSRNWIVIQCLEIKSFPLQAGGMLTWMQTQLQNIGRNQGKYWRDYYMSCGTLDATFIVYCLSHFTKGGKPEKNISSIFYYLQANTDRLSLVIQWINPYSLI